MTTWTIEQTKTGPRLELSGMTGAAYAVRFDGAAGSHHWQWLLLTARNRELEIERADVDATSEEMDAAEVAVRAEHWEWLADVDAFGSDDGPDTHEEAEVWR